MTYQPSPIDTDRIKLAANIEPLIEKLAAHNHDLWAAQRIQDGWKFGPRRNDERKEHPCLVPYAELPNAEKEYDRIAALGALKAIVALGYEVTKKPRKARGSKKPRQSQPRMKHG